MVSLIVMNIKEFKEILEKLQVKMKVFKDALKIVRPSAMREVLVEAIIVKVDENLSITIL